jgi:hypothetical protein
MKDIGFVLRRVTHQNESWKINCDKGNAKNNIGRRHLRKEATSICGADGHAE